METKYYTPPKAGKITRWLWKAAGADENLLEKCTYSDHVKYMSLGGIITATGVMAGLAGGYAMYMVFEPKGRAVEDITTAAINSPVHIPTMILAIVFGIVWGLIIFNLDRFIVSSTGTGDDTEKITKDEFLGALPRLFMGIVIAVTISKPMEIRIFKSEIDAELHSVQMKKIAAYKGDIEENYQSYIDEDEEKIKVLKAEISELTALRDEQSIKLQEEIAGRGTSGIPNCGPTCKQIKLDIARIQIELDDLKKVNEKAIQDLEADIQAWKEKMMAELDKSEWVASGLDGLLERIKIAHEIAGTGISLFITLLFVSIELTPIFFKLMLIKSPYNFLSDNVKELLMADEGIEVEHEVFPDNEGVQRDRIIYHKAEVTLHKQKELSIGQKLLTERIVKEWIAKESKKIKENPDDYIDFQS